MHYLIRGEAPRFAIFDADGHPDIKSVKLAMGVIPFADGLTEVAKSRLGGGLDRIIKADALDRPWKRNFQGIRVFIDRPIGFIQTGTAADGTPWSRPFTADNGFFPDTISTDDEELDLYLGPELDAPNAYLILQVRQDGTFDEYKVMLGFRDAQHALDVYLAHVPEWCFGGMTEIPVAFIQGLLGLEPRVLMGAIRKACPPLKKGAMFRSRKGRVLKAAEFRKLPIVVVAERVVEPTMVRTLEGEMRAEVGDWIVTGALNERYPVDPEAFRHTYEPANDEAQIHWDAAYGGAIPSTQVESTALAAPAPVTMAAWDAAYINDLPDSAFLYVEPGGTKDDGGRTTPRSLRHFPVRDAAGKPDPAHVRNALARIPQSTVPDAAKQAATKEAQRLLEELNKSAVAKMSAALGELKPMVDVAKIAMALVTTGKRSVWGLNARSAMTKKAADMTGWNAPDLDTVPELADHPARTAPITEVYSNPEDVGGWYGVIEPDDGSWIAFVDTDGNAYLWTAREPDGGVIGMPYSFKRPDVVIATQMGKWLATKRAPKFTEKGGASEHLIALTTSGDALGAIQKVLLVMQRMGEVGHSTPLYYDDDGLRQAGWIDGDGADKIVKIMIDGGELGPASEAVESPRLPPLGYFRALTEEQKARYTGKGTLPSAASEHMLQVAQDLGLARMMKFVGEPVDWLIQAGPPNEWSGAVADYLGVERRGVMTAAWDKMSATEQADVREAWMAHWKADNPRFGITTKGAKLIQTRAIGRTGDGVVDDAKIAKAFGLAPASPDSLGLNRQLIYSVVLEPNPNGGAGDAQRHTYAADDIEEACHWYAQFLMLNDQHGAYIQPNRAWVVQNFIAPVDYQLGDQLIAKGTWMLVVHVADPDLWMKVESGEWGAFSIEGYSKHVALS